MKNVLIVVPSLGIGGQERIAINTAMCLSDKYNVKIVIFQKSSVEYETSCEVIDLNLPAKNNVINKLFNQIRRSLRLARIRRQTKADIVFSLGSSANLTNALSSLISRGKSISSVHGFAEVKKNVVMDCILRFSDKVICIAKAMREGLLALYPKASNTCVIENGYDVESVIRQSTEETSVTIPANSLISMGRMERVKGFDRLIKAFSLVKKIKPNLNLVLLGKGILYDELNELAREEGIEDSVQFLGYQVNPYAYLRQADMYVLSSRNEGFPNCLIEALCCELPIVSMDCMSGPREILQDEYTPTRTIGIRKEKYGILIEESESDEENIERLAKAILETIENEELLARLKEQAVERAKRFGNQVYKEKIISLIEEVLSR